MKFKEVFRQLCEKLEGDNISFSEEDLNSVITYFSSHKGISDKSIEQFADSSHLSELRINQVVYNIVETLFNGGESVSNPAKFVDPAQLKKGTSVEFEHVDKNSKSASVIAEKIALDHLAEFSDYYVRLEKMEKEAKAEFASRDGSDENLEIEDIDEE